VADRKLFINQSARDPASALVRAFDDAAQAQTPIFFRGAQPSFELHFLLENPDPDDLSRPFIYDDPSGWDAVKMALGAIDAAVSGGSFTLTDPAGAQTTGSIPYGATAAAVQAAIRAGLTTNYSTATVSGADGGPYTILRVATGAIATLTATSTALAPSGSVALVENIQDGTATYDERFIVTLLKARAAERSTGWSALPAAAVSITPTVGSGTANKSFRVRWNGDAYAGNVTLAFTGDTVEETVGPIAYNASEDDVRSAFEEHTDVEDDGVSVLRNGPGDYTITCIGTGIKLSDTPDLAEASNTLSVPVGFSGTLNCATAGIAELLGSATSITTVLEIEKTVTSIPTTLLQVTTAEVRKDLIRNTAAASAALESAVQVAFLHLVTGYTGGGSTNLDGVATTALAVLTTVRQFREASDGFVTYQLVASTAAEASPGIIRPDDYNASTNAKVWESM